MKTLAAWLFALLAPLAACSRGPEPCASAGVCPEGQECLANRCVVAGGDPVPADSQRLVLEPEAMAVVGDPHEPGELPAAVTFGAGAGGTATLFLKFPPVWRHKQRIESAFLVLEPMPATFVSATDVHVDVWRVRERWEPSSLTALKQPELVPPRSRGLARSSPPSPLRIDVTALVTYLAENAGNDHGMALRAASGESAGASFATGTSGGRSPRLELYVR